MEMPPMDTLSECWLFGELHLHLISLSAYSYTNIVLEIK